jgi:aspartate racemase
MLASAPHTGGKETTMGEKIVGVLGGMGPEATLDIFRKILEATGAKTDQEHLRIIIDCNSKSPDRTAALLGGGEDPLPALRGSALLLARAGAGFIVIPCNAAHAWHAEIQKCAGIPVLHIMEAAVEATVARLPGIARVGLLAVTATVKTGLYQEAFAARHIETVVPDRDFQDLTIQVIYAVKAGRKDGELKDRIIRVGEHLAARGARAVVAGCTEIPLILADGDLPVPVIDATLALVEQAVAFARD